MTPEERFTRIENFLDTVAEHQAHMSQHLDNLGRHLDGLGRHQVSMARHQVHLVEHQADMAESQVLHDREIREIRAIQKAGEEKLNALIDTVDRIVRERGAQPS